MHSASSDCAAISPEKDVGAGHAMFTITTAGQGMFPSHASLDMGHRCLRGDYTLCYRSAGAQDSVAQSGDGVKLKASLRHCTCLCRLQRMSF